MREKKEIRINVGISSIILILLVFGLSAFAVLSVQASHNELKLAKKTAQSVTEYYEADSMAEKILEEIDQILAITLPAERIEKLSAMKEVSDLSQSMDGNPESLSYTVSMGDLSTLTVKLMFSSDLAGELNYDIIQWKMVNAEQPSQELEIEDENKLWDGEITE